MTRSEVLRELYDALERLDASQVRARTRPVADRVIDLRQVIDRGPELTITPPAHPGADWVLDDPRW